MTSLSGKSRIAGVAGWPVAHSLSPRLHGYWLAEHGIDGAYVPLPVRPERAAEAFRALPALGFAGCNVTVPHKETAFAVAEAKSPMAERIGAVNTLVCREDGTLLGDNTDGYGFIANLRAGAPVWRPDCGPAVVLGAGGSARAILAALIDAGTDTIILLNRTRDRAENLAKIFGKQVHVDDWGARNAAIKGAALIVNTTTLGMTGKEALEIDLSAAPNDATVTDLVYSPLETTLLRDARAHGLAAVDGLGMLLHQAVPGFEAWFGVRPEVTDELRRHVLAGRQ